ncbi:ergothioneine biosynthesis protein EgtB [Stenotrophomonas sp.]|uniref:ergothioneine biosynthesis protein EgtB n=1 Tax=Stenotrophomonas sp. TaxID=69392 RepID=UPI002D663729|nr:ergothioneine biosynthesis protein EgtB [Stenotrophomonas sp.]HYQ22943.1 ergothioneine biosynthesis protein EgtB [Stenotrophomonas sp.]
MDSATLAVAAPQRELAAHFAHVRGRSQQLAAPLSAEDAMLQSMDDASPAKWHLAHTTWFFERFVLASVPGHTPWDPAWDFLFNSYYKSLGPAHARPRRGLLSRPCLQQVRDYRRHVDEQVLARLVDGDLGQEALQHLQLGLQHEQQHQELLLTDIKHALWCNPLQPAYRADLAAVTSVASAQGWVAQDERIITVGAARWPQHAAFAYDNESPPHRVLLPAHAIADRPLSNGEYRAFVDAGGYRDPRWWLSEGWALCETEGWQHPLYWHDDLQREYTLGGWRALDPHAPVCHLSYYEADACARWHEARLPTEFEWEAAAAMQPPSGHFADDDHLHPHAGQGTGLRQLFGDVWEWTRSAYGAYPGFQPFAGNLGEYNGKFMCGQWVLRGGSCATPRGHVRSSYRNFFMPPARWQFSGVRLAKDLQ